MSKSKHKTFRNDYDDESYYEDFYRDRRETEKLKDRRKLNKIKNALRSKNIEALRYYDEDWYIPIWERND